MKNNVKITDIHEGVGISINGDVKFRDIEALAQNCSDGGCDCSPEMMSKIDNIKVNGKDGEVNIVLTSQALQENDIQSCMSECDCGF